MQNLSSEAVELTRAFLVRVAPEELGALDQLVEGNFEKFSERSQEVTFDWRQQLIAHGDTLMAAALAFFSLAVNDAVREGGKAVVAELFKRLFATSAKKDESPPLPSIDVDQVEREVERHLNGLRDRCSPEHVALLREGIKKVYMTKPELILKVPKK